MFSPLRRPGDYQNHAVNSPATPRGSSSPLNALSPIADAVRHATKEGTRDWHRMLGSLPEWTQPYSSERQERQRSQRSDTNMTRGQDSFTDAAESSTSLTPDLERHSIASASNRRYRPPVQYRESLFGSPQRSVISVAASTPSLDRSSLLPPPSLTPSSTRSASMVDDVTSQHSRTFDDDEHVSMAYRSPSRSISSRSKSSYKRHVMDPKRRASSSFESVKRYTETLSRGRLEDEIHRLDQLQRRLDTIQQVSSELATVTRDAANEIKSYKRSSPSLESSPKQRRILHDDSISTTPRRWSSRRSINQQSTMATEERPSQREECEPFVLTSPVSSPLQSTHMTPTTRESSSSLSRPSYASVAARRTPLVRKTPESKSSPIRMSTNATTRSRDNANTPNQLYRNVLSDITKAKLRPTATYRRASGTNIRNPFWEEIQAARAQQKEPNTTPMRDTTPAKRVSRAPSSSYTSRTPVSYPKWQQDEYVEDEYWPRPRRITEKLMSLAQEDKEEREAAMMTPGSLGDELEHAMRKSELEERQREREKAESMAFTLDPLDDKRSEEDKQERNGIQRIDGDEWMFDGRQYMVNEKKT